MTKGRFTQAQMIGVLREQQAALAHRGLPPVAVRRRHADAAGWLRYPHGSARRPQPTQEISYNITALSQ